MWTLEAIRDGAARALGAGGPRLSSRGARSRVQPDSLLHFSADIYSQRGDDGILREICRRIGIGKGTFVEFGAWDGVYLSNARLLFEYGWQGVFIEADESKFRSLQRNYRDYPDIRCIHSMVLATPGGGSGRSLDEILDALNVPHVDFLSIDIDGFDLDVFENMRTRPEIVCVEGGFSWHPEFADRVPAEVAARNLQQPLAVAVAAAQEMGYEPVCFNQNLYVVRAAHARHFGAIAKDPATLWLDAYFYQTDEFRERLRRFRDANPLIRRYEGGVRALPV